VGSDRELTAQPAEPIAADVREGKDGTRNGLLKLVAGVLGVRFDELRQRDQERRRRRLIIASTAALAVAATLSGLAIYGAVQRALAEQRARVGASRGLVFAGSTAAAANPDLALLLAVEAHTVSPTDESRQFLWELLAAQPRLLRFLATQGPTAVASDSTGQYAVTADKAGQLTVWNLGTGRPERGPLETGGKEVPLVAFVGTRPAVVAAVTIDDELVWWEEGSGRKSIRLDTNGAALTTGAFAADQPLLATLDERGTVAVWDLSHWPPTSRGVGEVSSAGTLHFLHGGSQLSVVDHGNARISTFALATSEPPETVPLTEKPGISTVDIAADGSMVATVNAKSVLQFWDAKSGRLQPLDLQLPGLVSSLRFNPEGTVLALGQTNGDVQLVDVKARAFIRPPLRPGSSSVLALAFDRAGTSLLSASRNGTVAQWNPSFAATPPLDRSIAACGNGGATSVSLVANATRLVSACSGGSITVQSLAPPSLSPTTISTDPERVTRLASSADGTLAVAVSQRGLAGTIRLTGPSVEWFAPDDPDDRFVTSAASGDAHVLAALSRNGQIVLFDVRNHSRRAVRLLPSGTRWVAMALDRAGATIAAASHDERLFVGSLTAATVTPQPLPGRIDPAGTISFRSDGTQLLAISADRRVLAWDPSAMGSTAHQLVPGNADLAVLSPDDALLLVARGDEVHLFAVQSAKDLGARQFPRLVAAAFSGDGKALVLSAGGSFVSLWSLDEREWAKAACRIANRDFTRQEIQDRFGQAGPKSRCSDVLAGRAG
jgi:WD40 repeat protein